MAGSYPLVFSELKAKVGVEDIARHLGYELDRKAGVGKYFELVLGDRRNPTDTLVVNNVADKSRQFWFRRNGQKGDVISLIKENLSSFAAEGSNEWSQIINVLARFANEPLAMMESRSNISATEIKPTAFNSERFEEVKITPANFPYLLKKRGFTPETIQAFGRNVLLLRDKGNQRFTGLNVGFPYTRPDNEALSGYEIRGNNGFKSKAAGTDCSNAAWIAEFPTGKPQLARNVYFFESSFDAIAFFQINRTSLESSPFALVSVGGAFNPEIVAKVMGRFPGAKAWDCFDNDLNGNLYAAALVKAVEKVDFKLDASNNSVALEHEGKKIELPKEVFDFHECANHIDLAYKTGSWKSPRNFKDWNDCLMGIPTKPMVSLSKYMRDENLRQQRTEIKNSIGIS